MEEYKKYSIKKDELELSINLMGYDLIIEDCEGKDILIEVDDEEEIDKRLSIEMEDEKLKIAENTKTSFSGYSGGEIILKLPSMKKYSGEIKSMSGDIEINKISYSGGVYSTSGDIEITSLKGNTDLKATTTSGDINLEELEGKLNVRSMSGDIDINDAVLSSFDGNTVSGDLSCSGKFLIKEDSSIKTVSGDLELVIDAAENLLIKSATVSGEVDIDGDYESTEKGEPKDLKTLTIKTVSGDVGVEIDESCKNVYAESSKAAKDFGIHISRMFDKKMHNDIHRTVAAVVKRVPRGVEVIDKSDSGNQEHISRILKMLEDGKINAGEARDLIDAL